MPVTVPGFDGPIRRSQARRGNRGEEGASDVPEGLRAPDLLGLRDETRNLRWAYAARREHSLIKPPNLARRTTGPAPMTSSVGIGI